MENRGYGFLGGGGEELGDRVAEGYEGEGFAEQKVHAHWQGIINRDMPGNHEHGLPWVTLLDGLRLILADLG
jgi:hypothetical protein